MAVYVNPATVQAASRMFGIFCARNVRKDGKNGGVFVVRMPSYAEFPEWRERVESCVEILFGGCDEMKTRRDWTVETPSGTNIHTMRMFEVPPGASWRESLANVALRSKKALVELGFDPESAERFGSSLERSVAEMESAADEKEAGTLARDVLSKLACAVQYPWVVDAPGEADANVNVFDKLRSKVFSPDFSSLLSEMKDVGAVQTHVFGVSPFRARCTDLFSFKKGDGKTPRGIEIGIGWDAILNARPAIDALVDALGKGGFFGEDRPVRAELKQTRKGDAHTGDPYGIQDMSGKKLFIAIPSWVKDKENPFPGGETAFVKAMLRMVSPWLNTVVQPDGFLSWLEGKDELSDEVRSYVDGFIEKVTEASDVYAKNEAVKKAAREDRSKEVEKGMDVSSRVVPYPGKPRVYVLLEGSENETSKAREAVDLLAAESGLRVPQWDYNKKYKYSYTYLTCEPDAEKNPLKVYEGRRMFAESVAEKIRGAGFDISCAAPVSLDVTIRVGGRAGHKGETWLMVEVPGAMDKELRGAVKKGDLKASEESGILSEIQKKLASLTMDDDGCPVEGVGDMMQISKEDAKTVFGIEVSKDGNDREALERHVDTLRAFLESEVVGDAKEKFPGAPLGIKVEFTKDKKLAERERAVETRVGAWKDIVLEPGGPAVAF